MPQPGPFRTALWLALAAVPVAALRYYMKGWLDPWGVGPAAGSFFASLTLLLVFGLAWIFGDEAGAAAPRFARAALAFTLVAAWFEVLVVAGILVTEAAHADTYYSGPWEIVHRAFESPAQHALAHAMGFPIRLGIALALGAAVFRFRRPAA